MPIYLAYFGKPGSFSHLVAQRIAPEEALTSRETVADVFQFVRDQPNHLGVVPVENSSAGMIESTIQHLVHERSGLQILAEYALHVRLALLQAKGTQDVKLICSHFAPLQHCQGWLEENFPGVKLEAVDSTTAAAARAAQEPGVAAIAPLSAGSRYGLETIHFPIGGEALNLTQFFLLGQQPLVHQEARVETSLALVLKNEVGSLCRFLTPFALQKINLKRIKSQNVYGHPNTYIFFVGVEASAQSPQMVEALAAAQPHSQELHILGSYPVFKPFES
jgi:prephenate dehydratase